jgi:hypothetical protein
MSGRYDQQLETILKQAQQQPRQQQMLVASPLNDVQLVALMAVQLLCDPRHSTPRSAVTAAMEIVAEAMMQVQPDAFRALINKHQLEGRGQS